MTPERIAELRAKCEAVKATAGHHVPLTSLESEFYTTAYTAVPELLDERDRLRAGLEVIQSMARREGWPMLYAEALLAGADLRDLEVAAAVAAGTWTPMGEMK